MIEWVVEQAHKAKKISDVIVATDDSRIQQTVNSFGGQAVMTSQEHSSGTDRIAEVANNVNCDVVVNLQGDEPLILPEDIDNVVEPFFIDPGLNVSTLKVRLKKERDILDPNVTKVVTDERGFALYFSRSPIPFCRNRWGKIWKGGILSKDDIEDVPIYKHIGIYGFSRNFLLKFSALPRLPLEELEQLEQLRILGHGIQIRVIKSNNDSIGVDSLEDLLKVEQRLNS